MYKLITVFGATGNQGGSIINAILADPTLSSTFKIRGITRDITKPAAKALASKGVELATADLNSQSSVAAAIKGSHTVFLVTNYWETMSADTERSQGKNVADAAKADGVEHLIFSSLLNVTEISGGRLAEVPHFDAKADVEKYIRDSGISCTFVLPGYFMSNFGGFLKKGEDGVFTLALPIGEETGKFPLIDIVEDYGKFVALALKNPTKYNGKQIYAASSYYTPKQILSDFEAATGQNTRFVRVSDEQYMSFLPESMAEEMLQNHLLLDGPGYYNGADLEEGVQALETKPRSWKEFVEKSGIW